MNLVRPHEGQSLSKKSQESFSHTFSHAISTPEATGIENIKWLRPPSNAYIKQLSGRHGVFRGHDKTACENSRVAARIAGRAITTKLVASTAIETEFAVKKTRSEN